MQRVVRWPALSCPCWWHPPPPPPRRSPWPPPSLTSRPLPPPRPLLTSPSCQSKASSFHPTTILISAGKHSHLILPGRFSISSSMILNRLLGLAIYWLSFHFQHLDFELSKDFEGDDLYSDLNLSFRWKERLILKWSWKVMQRWRREVAKQFKKTFPILSTIKAVCDLTNGMLLHMFHQRTLAFSHRAESHNWYPKQQRDGHISALAQT